VSMSPTCISGSVGDSHAECAFQTCAFICSKFSLQGAERAVSRS
jgi:hypothetical protein